MKYSTRHYIHPRCALAKWGNDIVNRFPVWMLEQMPYKALQEANLLETVTEYCKARHAGQRGHFVRGLDAA